MVVSKDACDVGGLIELLDRLPHWETDASDGDGDEGDVETPS